MDDIEKLLIAATPGGIEQQEANGQSWMVRNRVIPRLILGATRRQLTGIGFRFGTNVDALFVECKLPAGWKMVSTDHNMYSDLQDDQGRVRAEVFYKNSSYDRSADMELCPRFTISGDSTGSDKTRLYVRVLDTGKSICEVGDFGRKYTPESHAESIRLHDMAMAWLTGRYPEWRNPMAYWD